MWHEGQGRHDDESRLGTGGTSIWETQLWNAGSAGLSAAPVGIRPRAPERTLLEGPWRWWLTPQVMAGRRTVGRGQWLGVGGRGHADIQEFKR